MDFNLPRYTEHFSTCKINDPLIDITPEDKCQIEGNNKILDEKYGELRNEWINKWNEEYDKTTDAGCKSQFINKIIEVIENADTLVINPIKDNIKNAEESILNKHETLNKINNSMEDTETNFLLGEQRLLESQGFNYINNAKFYIFIALIIILLLIQLMLILL
jgi:hypothetical protein